MNVIVGPYIACKVSEKKTEVDVKGCAKCKTQQDRGGFCQNCGGKLTAIKTQTVTRQDIWKIEKLCKVFACGKWCQFDNWHYYHSTINSSYIHGERVDDLSDKDIKKCIKEAENADAKIIQALKEHYEEVVVKFGVIVYMSDV